ncbi:hypothetical protein AB4Z01_35715 [Inquilinus sp. YAF38]
MTVPMTTKGVVLAAAPLPDAGSVDLACDVTNDQGTGFRGAAP